MLCGKTLDGHLFARILTTLPFFGNVQGHQMQCIVKITFYEFARAKNIWREWEIGIWQRTAFLIVDLLAANL